MQYKHNKTSTPAGPLSTKSPLNTNVSPGPGKPVSLNIYGVSLKIEIKELIEREDYGEEEERGREKGEWEEEEEEDCEDKERGRGYSNQIGELAVNVANNDDFRIERNIDNGRFLFEKRHGVGYDLFHVRTWDLGGRALRCAILEQGFDKIGGYGVRVVWAGVSGECQTKTKTKTYNQSQRKDAQHTKSIQTTRISAWHSRFVLK
jgi:hypothetical protein